MNLTSRLGKLEALQKLGEDRVILDYAQRLFESPEQNPELSPAEVREIRDMVRTEAGAAAFLEELSGVLVECGWTKQMFLEAIR